MSQSKFFSGLITGAAIGVGMSMLVSPSNKQKKIVKRGANNLFKTVGSVIDNTIDMYK